MSNINLYKSDEEKAKGLKKESALSGVFFFSILVMFLVLASWVGVKVAKSAFEKEKTVLDERIQAEEQKFSPGGADIQRVYDFTKRVDLASGSVISKPDQAYLFSVIETGMIPEVKASEISYTNKNGSIEAIMVLKTSKFIDVARQILSFKESKKFAGILVEEISREEKDVVFKVKAAFLQNKENNQ